MKTHQVVMAAVALAVANGGIARADALLVQNRSRLPVFFELADVDGECRNGMRDHGWISLQPGQGQGLTTIGLNGLVLAAGFAQFVNGEIFAMVPNSHFSEELLWSVPLDGSSDAQCSDVVSNGNPDEHPTDSRPIWIAQWNKGPHCIPSVHGGDLNLGLMAYDGPSPDNTNQVFFDFFCFGADGMPSKKLPVDDSNQMQ